MLSFKIVKMAKGQLAKKCARKIVNCYRMFAELREALAGGRALDKGERRIASSAPGHKHLRHLVAQFLLEASDLATEVTPKASSTCENEAEGVQLRPSTKSALFSDQYSELEDEITHDIPIRQKPAEDIFLFDKQAFEAQFLFSLFSLIPGKSSRATSRVVLKSSLSMIT